jgi:hypothetical protein
MSICLKDKEISLLSSFNVSVCCLEKRGYFAAGHGLYYGGFFGRLLLRRKIKRSFLNEEEQSMVCIFLGNAASYCIYVYKFCQTGRE